MILVFALYLFAKQGLYANPGYSKFGFGRDVPLGMDVDPYINQFFMEN